MRVMPHAIKYAVAKPNYLQRASIDDPNRKTLLEWVLDPHFPFFDTNIGAKRAYCVALEPEREGHSDDLIRQQFRSWAHNLKCVKILRVKVSA